MQNESATKQAQKVLRMFTIKARSFSLTRQDHSAGLVAYKLLDGGQVECQQCHIILGGKAVGKLGKWPPVYCNLKTVPLPSDGENEFLARLEWHPSAPFFIAPTALDASVTNDYWWTFIISDVEVERNVPLAWC